jgi:dihydroflavonol-4-reductase
VSKTLVTGATGFIGSHVARALLDRGDDVRVLVRASSKAENLQGLELDVAKGDIGEPRSISRALRGVDRVFHVAGLTSLRASNEKLHTINVVGTRNVLDACMKAGVEHVVYTSSVAAIGPAPKGETADERQHFSGARLNIPYVNAKHEAEIEAQRFAALGLPVVIVNPGHVFGRGDVYRSSTELVRRFMLRRIPAYVDGGINVIDVGDVAKGHLLADEKGTPGERYILGNRNYTLDRLFADLGRMSGIEPPALKVPYPVAIAFAQAAERMPGRPPVTTVEVRGASQWWTYRNTKAKRELGFKPAPHEETVSATVEWYLEREADRFSRSGTGQPFPLKFAGGVLKRAGSLAGRMVL